MTRVPYMPGFTEIVGDATRLASELARFGPSPERLRGAVALAERAYSLFTETRKGSREPWVRAEMVYLLWLAERLRDTAAEHLARFAGDGDWDAAAASDVAGALADLREALLEFMEVYAGTRR